jgi:site-specific DNA recombinase
MAAVDLAQVQGTDKLVTWRLDRLGRDSAEYIPLLKGLRRLGVDVVSVTQPTESIFMQQVIGIMAEEESRQLSTRVTAGKQRRAQEGKWGGLPPFGYGTEKHPTGGSVLVPNALGPLVTKMFERYATGRHSLADLRKFLQDSGYVKTRYGVSAMLRNPAYVGIVRHGTHTSSQFHPQGEVLETKGAHPPLIDRATFDRVQDRLSPNKSRQLASTPRQSFSKRSRGSTTGIAHLWLQEPYATIRFGSCGSRWHKPLQF